MHLSGSRYSTRRYETESSHRASRSSRSLGVTLDATAFEEAFRRFKHLADTQTTTLSDADLQRIIDDLAVMTSASPAQR